MSPKWIMAILLLMFFFSFINGIGEQVYLSEDEAGVINTLISGGTMKNEAGIKIKVSGDTRLDAFVKIVTFDYAHFQNEWTIVRILFCILPASVLFMLLVNAVAGIASFLGRFLKGGAI